MVMSIVAALTFWLPGAGQYPLYLPWGLDDIVVSSFTYFKSFVAVFPPLEIVLQAFLLYLGWKIAMMFLRLFIGNRTPNAL